jgi:hypothetical protein
VSGRHEAEGEVDEMMEVPSPTASIDRGWAIFVKATRSVGNDAMKME